MRQEAEGHVHLLKQEAVGHVERARHEAQQARSSSQPEVSSLRHQATQEISSREQKILLQSKVLDTLGSENLLLSQRLADLERAVASMAQNVAVPPDESHESQNPTDPGSSGLNDVGRDLQVGSQAPQVQGPSDATREQYPPKDAALGASGSSSSDPKVAPRAPQPDIKSDAKRVQMQDGDPRAQPQGPPHVARTQDVRGPVDVQAQMSSLTEETVVRIKDLKGLVLPLPPENAGQARGYVNQVLMASGRLKTWWNTNGTPQVQCQMGA